MDGFWENAAVIAIVAMAVFWALRGVWRATRKKQICTSCASSGGCPLAEGKVDKPISSECLTPDLKVMSLDDRT